MRPAGVHVKAIGSADTTFSGGETDLRGIFVADALRGKVTAIARDAESRYAFYRGDTWLGTPAHQPDPQMGQQFQRIPGPGRQVDYQGNLRLQNDQLQRSYNTGWDNLRRSGGKGVQVDKAR